MKGIINQEILQQKTLSIIGKNVSHVWQGHGSAIFLEIGALTHEPKRNHPTGEFTIMIQDSWRVENKNKILFGSWSEPEVIENLLPDLKDIKINKINMVGNLPEIRIKFSNNLALQSFATTEGDPQWAILSRKSSIYSQSAKLVLEPELGE